MSEVESWVVRYLLNSLWMIPLVFFAGCLASRAVRRTGPQVQHRVWVGALWMQVLLPVIQVRIAEVWRFLKMVWRWWGGRANGDGSDVSIRMATGAARVHGGLQIPQWLAASITVAYICVLAYVVLRFSWRLLKTRALMRDAAPIGPGAILNRWAQHTRRAGIQNAVLAFSPETRGPVAVGMRQGMLLVPPGFFDGIEENDIDAVMAHECAHIQRHDFVKNVIYCAIALPITYHPLLRLTLARIAESREMVCDAIAATFAGRGTYARSLLRLAALLLNDAPAKPFHAIGIFDANGLEERIMNLTRRSAHTGWAMRLTMLAVCMAIGALTCASAMALRMDVGAEKDSHSAPLKVDPRIIAGQVTYQKPPVYPAEAKANHDTLNGPVILEAIIDKAGLVKDLRVKQSLRADYDRSAVEAVKDWRYKPFLLNGEPTEVETTITVNYSLLNHAAK